MPYDLSDVFFITTCNVLDTIPPALRDRLEVIHFPGYTEDEKFHIGRDFLFEKEREIHGIPKGSVTLTDKAILAIINLYTREAGVRSLEREVAAIFRKIAKKIADAKAKKRFTITPTSLHEYSGSVEVHVHACGEKR